jgi:L-cysteine S-thiosulfotransferase
MRSWASPLGALACAGLVSATAVAQTVGSVERGRVLLANRTESGCVLCHQVPGLPAGGELGPPLTGLARLGGAQMLRERIADARRFNPQTIMPPYLSTDGLQDVAAAYRGQTVLTPQGLDDIVAYLMRMAP